MSALNNGLKFLEDWDNYATADLPAKWTSSGGSISIGAYGRNGTNGFRLTTYADFLRKTYDAQSKWVVASAYQISDFPGANTIFALQDAGTYQCSLVSNPDGTLSVYRSRPGSALVSSTLLSTTTFSLRANVYSFIEWVVTIGSSAAYEVWVNGVQWLSTTGNTQNTGNSTANGVQLGCGIPTAGFLGANADYDDHYCCSGSSATRIGDSRPFLFSMSGAGFYNDFTPNPNVSHNLNIDDTTPDGDSTYNDATAAGQRDSYTYSPTITGPIYGVQIDSWARNTDAATTNFKLFHRISGTNYDGSIVQSPNTTYTWYGELWENSPASLVQWTSGELTEVGMHRTV